MIVAGSVGGGFDKLRGLVGAAQIPIVKQLIVPMSNVRPSIHN